MENLFQKERKEYVQVINGKWTVFGKTFNECSLNEKLLIGEKAKQLKFI